jgi:Spy/CpxP family protein refolding chaperone
MKGKKHMVVAGVLVAAVMLTLGAGMLYAHFGPHWGPGCGSPEERAAWITERVTKRLELTDAQRHDLEAMVIELGGKRKEAREFHLKARGELLGMLREENLDGNRVKQLVSEHKQFIGKMLAGLEERLTEFGGTLTPEQRARLADMIEEHSACFQERWH